jgi:RNA polymerase sigma factor (sigma-70 family)
MRDSEVVASIVAGDALGLAAAYDRYAEPLHQYCRTLLADSADAADAVQDTFVIAESRLGGLRDPDRLRPWLYAVARNEARRILRSKKGTSALDEAPDMTDDSGDIAADAARVDLRALLEDAAAGLNPGERELIELQLRQGLETTEVATVLGVSRDRAHALLSRASQQLETCLAALLVGRAGRGECGELGAMLDGWDGRLTILLRKRVHRHIAHCATCTARRANELRPAMLLDLSPGAALAAGAAISLRLARGAPEGLRAHTITLATGQGAGAVAHRAAVLSRAGAFTGAGFPQRAHGAKVAFAAHGGPGRAGSGGAGSGGAGSGGAGRAGRVTRALRSSPKGAATVAAVIVIAVIIAAVAFALTGGTQTLKPAAGPSPARVAAAATPAAASTSAAAGGSAGRKTRLKATSAATSARSAASATARPTAQTTAALAVAPTRTTASPPVGAPSATPTTARPTPPAIRPAPTPTPGALSVYPRGRTLVLEPNGPGRQIDLSGSGAGDWYVTWSVAVANDPENAVSVSPATGTLGPGDSTATVTVTVTARQFVPCGWRHSPTITVSPGGAVFSVCTGRSRHFTGDGSARADDDAGHASPPGRKPDEHRAGPSAQPGVGSHHGRVL